MPDDVVTRPSPRQLLGLAWPIVLQRSAQVVVGFTDALMVARLGEAALGATTAAGHNAFAVFILPMGTVFIVSSFAAQLAGRRDPAAARRYAWYGLAVAVATQIACVAAVPQAAAAPELAVLSALAHGNDPAVGARVAFAAAAAASGLPKRQGRAIPGLGSSVAQRRLPAPRWRRSCLRATTSTRATSPRSTSVKGRPKGRPKRSSESSRPASSR